LTWPGGGAPYRGAVALFRPSPLPTGTPPRRAVPRATARGARDPAGA